VRCSPGSATVESVYSDSNTPITENKHRLIHFTHYLDVGYHSVLARQEKQPATISDTFTLNHSSTNTTTCIEQPQNIREQSPKQMSWHDCTQTQREERDNNNKKNAFEAVPIQLSAQLWFFMFQYI